RKRVLPKCKMDGGQREKIDQSHNKIARLFGQSKEFIHAISIQGESRAGYMRSAEKPSQYLLGRAHVGGRLSCEPPANAPLLPSYYCPVAKKKLAIIVASTPPS